MSAPITLLTGDYYIQMHDEPRRFIGVDPHRPMFPRALCALPEGQQPLWHIQNLDDVRYVIKQHNLAAIVQGDSVVAQPTQIPHQWIVQHMPSEGQFAFVILNNYPGEQEDSVWSLDSAEAYTKVQLRKTKWRGIRIPVDLPKNSLFNILPLVNKAAPTTQPQPHTSVLPDGRYLIKKRGLNGGFVAVDESPAGEPEDRKVFVLPGGTKAPVWEVNDARDGIYTIRQGDWITGSGASTVVARKAPFLPQQWRLQAFPLEGENTYIVHSGSVSGNPSWAVTSSKPYALVDLKKLGPFAPENPPQEALFEFIPVPKDEELGVSTTTKSDIVIELPAGRYLIKRHGVRNDYLAVKDSSEELRPVVVLPGGTKAPVWNVTSPNFGRYEISSEGYDTRPKGDAVVAGGVSIQQGRWFLQRYLLQGENCYIIVDDSNTNCAWSVTKSELYAPVELRDVGFFIPEAPPKDLLFDLIPVPEDGAPSSSDVAPKPTSLPRGEYLIKKHGEHGNYIAIKDGSEEFRPVITLPGGTLAPKWNIGAVNPGRYEISSAGFETHPEGDRIVAGGISIMQGQWFLRHYPQKGQYSYMIVSDMDPNLGWAVTKSEGYAPVEFQEIGPFAPELPPPEFLFDLLPVKRA